MRRKAATATVLTLLLLPAPVRSDERLTDQRRVVHTLNRITFGPAPGDVDRIAAMGIDRYIAEQLHPERIDDAAIDSRLAVYRTLQLSNEALVDNYIKPQMEARRARRNGDAAEPLPQRRNQVPLELTAARLERAIHSRRQLHEVLVDFWMNHFNVFAGKGLDRVFIVGHERDTIRPNVWGTFDELLIATAKSPAMLFYLDNARSVAAPEARSTRRNAARRNQRGLNENYARELLELHTLGVDGGYTQKDVTELARVLTGWSIARPEESGNGFIFRAALHDRGSKTVLGQNIPAGGGIEEGERMLRFLALHPSTAKHLARKLVQKFVADEPPPALVDRVAARFLATRGDLRETLRAVLTSPEFTDSRYFRGKMKTPFEYVVSAMRATSSPNSLAIARTLRDLGQPLYFSQPPTGYSELAEEWVSSGALIKRLNFAIALAGAQIPGVSVPRQPPVPLELLSRRLLGEELTLNTRATIDSRLDAVADPDKRMQLATALILGSPEFQKQ